MIKRSYIINLLEVCRVQWVRTTSSLQRRRHLINSPLNPRVKMLYWLIPYLVAFNTTGSENWTHGPEYLFNAEIERSIKLDSNRTTMGEIDINFSCRPLNESSIRCRVESAETTDSETHGNAPNEEKKEVKQEFNVAHWAFEVQFDRKGLRSIVSLNNEEEEMRRNIIQAIFDAINIGSDYMSEIKVGRSLLSNEASMIGVCDASVRVSTSKSSNTPGTPVAFYMDVPSFTERAENETLTIMKDRFVNHCSEKTPYFFGSHLRPVDGVNFNVTISETGFFFGRHRFSGGTANAGTFTVERPNPEHSDTTLSMSGKAEETIHVKLEAIRGATEKL